MFRFILSKQKISKELKSIKLTQVNFDLYSEEFMGGINLGFIGEELARDCENLRGLQGLKRIIQKVHKT